MHKLLFFILLFIGFVHADKYPETFSKLGTPLYLSAQKLSSLDDTNSLTTSINSFCIEAEKDKKEGFYVDKSNAEKDKKNYLLQLRKLQKKYDYILHLVHKEINKSIDNQEYEIFVKLTSHELDGLLENSTIRAKAVEFYNKNKTKKLCRIIENKIYNDKLYEATSEEFYNEIVKSSYNSNKGDKTPRKSVYISTKRELNKIEVSLINTNPYDVTVGMKSHYSNIIHSQDTPSEFVIKAKTTMHYTTLTIGKDQSTYVYEYSWIIGNKDAVHDDTYLYRFPFETSSTHTVSQGYNGAYTHTGSSQYALDFMMDEGTKVCASREGVVVRTKADSNRGGYDKKYASDGNYVTIAHAGGTLATYYHLKRGGVSVNVGEYVGRGRVLGYSGNTGFSSGPHLHFAVFTAKNSKSTQTIALKFIDNNGVVDIPTQGQNYTAK